MAKLWVPRFLQEDQIRTGLSSLYVGLVGSSENAENFLANQLGRIKKENSKGNLLVKQCFNASIRWLRYLQEFSINKASFSNQVLEPARSSARFILRARKETPRSTSTLGVLIRRSKPFFDRYFDTKVVTISFALPELASVSSLRCRVEDASNLEYGIHEIHGIQPLPFVNRMHPTKLRFQSLKLEPDIAKLSFLKISSQDLSNLDYCLAFENFCEIWSEQAEVVDGQHGRRLGIPYIVGGIALPTAGPYLILRGIGNNLSSPKFFATKQFLKLLERSKLGLGQINGKLMRILGIAWYRYGSHNSTPEYHEAVVPQLVKNPNEILIDDLVGYIRIRNSVKLSTLHDMYNKIDFSSLPSSLKLGNDRVSYIHLSMAKDTISKIHIEETNRIRFFRKKVNLVTSEGILDTRRLHIKSLSDWLRSKKYILDSLLALIKYYDSEGYLPSKNDELVKAVQENSIFGLDQESCGEKLEWLDSLGLIHKRKEEPVSIKKRGLRIAFLIVKQQTASELKCIVKKQKSIDLQQLELVSKIPHSIALMVLRDLKKDGTMECSMVNGERCELYWFNPEVKIKDFEVNEKVDRLERVVLGALNVEHVPLHVSGIIKNIRKVGLNMSFTILHIILSMLKNKGRICKKPKLNLWIYPRKNRITDVFRYNPAQVLTPKEIALKISLAPLDIHMQSVETILRELDNDGFVFEILPRRWAMRIAEGEDRERRHSLLRSDCRDQILEVLGKNANGVTREKLLSKLIPFISSIKTKLGVLGSSIMIANNIIEQMSNSQEILASEDKFSLPPDKV